MSEDKSKPQPTEPASTVRNPDEEKLLELEDGVYTVHCMVPHLNTKDPGTYRAVITILTADSVEVREHQKDTTSGRPFAEGNKVARFSQLDVKPGGQNASSTMLLRSVAFLNPNLTPESFTSEKNEK
jgi:hypothetical protein